MAVLAIFRASGDPADLLPRYERTLAGATALASARPEAHFCVPTESGIMIVDVWNSRAELQRAVIDNKAFRAKWDEAGWPEETVEIFEVHNSDGRNDCEAAARAWARGRGHGRADVRP